jgi:hypothetical protein
LLFRQDYLAAGPRAAAAAAILLTLVALGGLLERKPWAFSLETLRVCLMAIVAVGAGAGGAFPMTMAAVAVAASVALLAWLSRYRDAVTPSEAFAARRG